jgi:capsular polysaccharide biosynthesis protein
MNMRFGLGERPSPDDVSFHPEAVEYLRRKLIPPELRTNTGTRRLWVSRAKRNRPGQRRLRNEAEIEAWYESQGFETVIPESMSFDEQVAAFSQAEVVAGCAGAGMINTLFAPANARILIFTKNHPLVNYHYFTNIAHSIGQSLTYVCGESARDYGALGFQADFTIDMSLARRALLEP